jgi:YD repeat-containing protein
VNGLTSTVTRDYLIAGEAKIGIFSVSFRDLSIPLGGLPITLTRTYDSRVKTQEDFGIGWTLGIKRGSYQNNRPPGDGWRILPGGGLLNPPCSISDELKFHLTDVRLSDARSYQFALQVNMFGFGSAITGGCVGQAEFVQVAGPPGVSLEVIGSNEVVWLSGGDSLTYGLGSPLFGQVWEPREVRLTTPDGRLIDFHLQSGVTDLQEPNGNRLSITPAGVIHTSGTAVSFTRDAQGRITQIVDPSANSLSYAYDAAGDLVAFTDQAGNTTRFEYDRSHYLVRIVDANGIIASRNIYDESGRLVSVIDAEGNRRDIEHDLDGRREVVQDTLGNPTIYLYDEDGNVTSVTNPLGHTTTYTYDADGNELSKTDPLGNTSTATYDASGNVLTRTDALGHTTAFTYDSGGRVLTETDSLGNVITNTYDSAGNQLTRVDRLGNATTNTFTSDGNVAAITDPEGNVIQFSYDANGYATQRISASGAVTTYINDANCRWP